MTSAVARTYIQQLAQSGPPEVRRELQEIATLHERRLWHQLTVELRRLVQHPYFDKAPEEAVVLYERFIKTFETKLSQLELAKILLSIVKRVSDPVSVTKYLEGFAQQLNPEKDLDAFALTKAECALVKFQLGQGEGAKKDLDLIHTKLESKTGLDPGVYSSYYKALSIHFKAKVQSSEFYKNGLMYLLYTPIEEISLSERRSFAVDLLISALVAPEISNFGELLAHGILQSLDGTPEEWLVQFVRTINSGNVASMNTFLTQHAAQIAQQAALQQNIALLRQKATLLALMELVFSRGSEQRIVKFGDISGACSLPIDEVEYLLMRGMSLKLLKGEIDQVLQQVTITWVQPRVLDFNQIDKMRERLERWRSTVHQTLVLMENEAAD